MNICLTWCFYKLLLVENIIIYDSKGQKVISGNFNFSESGTSSELYKIDIPKLNNGLYIIKTETINKSVIKKFILSN